MKIWITQGLHPYVPGRVVKAFASEVSANTEAAALLNVMLKDCHMAERANNSTWPALLSLLQAEQEVDADVWVDELDLQD